MTVYETLERPLVTVLARMERRGISIDRQALSRLSGELGQKQVALEAEIKELADGLLNAPVMIEVARRNSTVEIISQKIHPVDRDRKRELRAPCRRACRSAACPSW